MTMLINLKVLMYIFLLQLYVFPIFICITLVVNKIIINLLLLSLLLQLSLLFFINYYFIVTQHMLENKHINVSINAKYDIENIVGRKGLLSILLFILLFQ